MKRTHFLLTSALLFGCLCCPSFSHAIITDPDDYIVYDTGILMENCRIDNQGGTLSDGETGGHLIQFDASADYSLNHFSFIHNVVSNFHGSQMFNVGRNGSTSSDDYSIHIDGNLFYKVGGNAKSSLRSFLEFGSIPSESSVDISIADNIFYKRWSSNYYPVALLSLFDADTTVVSNILIANNLYEGKYYTGDESLMANPMAPTNSDENNTSTVSIRLGRSIGQIWTTISTHFLPETEN